MTSLFTKLINFLKKKEVRHIQLDPETLKNNETISALAYENAELKGELNRVKSKEIEEKKLEEQRKSEDKIKVFLNKQKQEIEIKKQPTYFSLRAFFNKLRKDKKFRKSLAFYSFDGSTKLSPFQDIGFTSDNKMVLIGKNGEVIMTGERIQDLFYNLGSLRMDVMAKRIPLPVTPEGGFFENIMKNWEPAQIIPTPEGKFQYTHAPKKPLYAHLKELQEERSGLQQELEQRDLTITGLQNEIRELKIAMKMYRNNSETAVSNLSQAENESSEITKAFRGLSNELAKQRDTNVVLEDNINKLENQLEKMRDEAEREGIKLSDNKAMEIIQTIRRELVRDEPSKEVHIIEKPSPTPQTIPVK